MVDNNAERLAAERPLPTQASLDVNAGVSSTGLAQKAKKNGPPDTGEDGAWLPS